MTAHRNVALAIGLVLLGAAALQVLVSSQRRSVELEAELRAEQRDLAAVLGAMAESPEAVDRLAAALPQTTVRRVSLSPRAAEAEQPRLDRAQLAPLLAGEPFVQVSAAHNGADRLLTYAAVSTARESAVELTRVVPAAARSGSVLFSGAMLLAACAVVVALSARIPKSNAKARDQSPLPPDFDSRLEHLNHMAIVGTLSSGIIHDIGTPLNVISGRAMMITAGDVSPSEIGENAGTIKQQCLRIAAMVRSLLTFARRTSPAMPQALADIVREDIALLEPIARGKKIKLELVVTAADAGTPVERSELRQVIVNILMNGLQVMPQGGRLGIEVGVAHDPAGREGHWAYVVVEDAGAGIAPEHMDRIFEPFFTTQPQREGAGIGLAVAHRVVTRHGGFIDVKSEQHQGTRFTVYLPQRSPK